jgi:hypothetical protein
VVSDLFYLQDSRTYVGNDVMWWARPGEGGYTTDLSKARLFTKEDAIYQHHTRETDIPWPKDYIDGKTRPAVDMQYINREEALRDTGITLLKPQQPRKYVNRCCECGRFLSDAQVFSDCPNCGADNRP